MSNLTLEIFLEDVASHQLTVNLDQDVYRDITIKKPNDVHMHYNITTRPGFLMFSGDMGDFIFERTNDMFGFFRSEDEKYYINPGYWGEKVQAGEVSKFDIASMGCWESESDIIKVINAFAKSFKKLINQGVKS